MSKAGVVVLAVALASCRGGGGHRPQPPNRPAPSSSPFTYTAPQEFLDSIVSMKLRLPPGTYTVKFAEGLDLDHGWKELGKTSALTGGAIKFIPWTEGKALHFEIGINPNDPALDDPNSETPYAGVMVYNVNGHTITGGRVVFSEQQWYMDPGICGHEFGHMLGLSHVPGRYRLGDCYQIEEYHPWEVEGWHYLQEMVFPSSVQEPRQVLVREKRFN